MLDALWYHLATFLLLHIVSIRAVVYVTVPDVYTAIEEDTIIKCYIVFLGKEALMPDKITFEMVGTNLRCEVTNWLSCPPVYMSEDDRPENFTCGCLLHTDEHSYIFYLYLRSCPKDLDNTRFKCSPALPVGKESDGQLRLIDFSKKPELEICRCEGESVYFPWEYNPNEYKGQMRVSHVSWLYYPAAGDPVFIGTFENDIVHSRDMAHFGARASIHKVPLKETIPFLEIKHLQHGDSGAFQIEIMFLSQEAVDRLADKTSSPNETFSGPLHQDVQGDLNQDDEINPSVKPPSNDRLRAQSTLPKEGIRENNALGQTVDYANESNHRVFLLADFVAKINPILRSSTTLHIVDPMQDDISIVFKKVIRSGELFLFCSVSTFSTNTSFEHLSFVLKQHDKVLQTAQWKSFLLLKIDLESTMDNYSCEITGEAVRCANMRKLHNRTLWKNIDYLLKDETGIPVITLTFTLVDVVFVLEGVACGFLLIWNCSLMAKHVGYLCSRKAKFEQKKLQDAIDTSYLKRKSALEITKRHIRFAMVVTPPSPDTSTRAVSQDDSRMYTDDVSLSSDRRTEQEGSMSSWQEDTQNSQTETQE